ncbi:ABC transporter ATP-binding protein [Rhizocola hellebori]|uniref:ABC transporter ATP-binding protein n=1 Tax=Rhizocola hellebori TaxID=1392758 RepID=A0A8J3Q718_9ACTN|nr:ABC transporter ATP-binding protein [Rhizocola hellebori]GIH05159.1 ABC transporter ATP-binding protein [Rhizocola hellebori]
MNELLRCQGLSRTFGAVRAVCDVDLSVSAGSRHALIGPNGAGKTTLLRLIGGSVAATSGRVWFGGADVTAWSQPRRAQAGVGQTFQHSTLFPTLSVAQNVSLALQRSRATPWWPLPRKPIWSAQADESLRALGLAEHAHRPVRSLSYGECRRLEVAVAMVRRPSLLLLDEPAAGMSAAESVLLTRTLRALPMEVTVLFVEHDLDLVFDLATRISVLHLGTVLATGTPSQIRENPMVQQAYLGSQAKEQRHVARA